MTQPDSPPSSKKKSDITVTFNGKETSIHKMVKEAIAATDHDKMKDWRSKEVENETKLREEKATEVIERTLPKGPFDWRGFEPPETAATLSQPLKKKKRKKKKASANEVNFLLFVKKFWIPFLSAIIVGLGLGFTVLLVFSNHKTVTTAVTTPNAPGESQVQTAVSQPSSSPTSTVSGKDYALNLNVIQIGFFKSQSSAKTAQTNYEGKGIHCVIISTGGNYALFSGVALSKSDLGPLNNSMKNKVSFYDKGFLINPKNINGTKRDLQDLKTANLVIQNLIPLSLSAINQQKVDGSVLSQVKKALDQMEDPSSGETQQELGTLKGTLLAAYSSLNQTHPNGQGAQSALLDAIGSYNSIINSRSK